MRIRELEKGILIKQLKFFIIEVPIAVVLTIEEIGRWVNDIGIGAYFMFYSPLLYY